MRSFGWLFAATALLAGCAQGDAPDEAEDADTTGGTQAAADVNTVGAMLYEWRIEMPDTLQAGQTRIDAMNHGTVVHGIEVEGQGIEEKVEEIQPNGTSQLLVNLQPGTYEVYCPVVDERGNHKELGMTKQVVVR